MRSDLPLSKIRVVEQFCAMLTGHARATLGAVGYPSQSPAREQYPSHSRSPPSLLLKIAVPHRPAQ